MKTRKLTATVSMFLVGGFCLISTAAFGELMTFTVDSTQSSLSVTGSFFFFSSLRPQGANSLTTKYGGIILADVTGSTITFVGGSSITASNSGDWGPGIGGGPGTAPANYGAADSAVWIGGYSAAVRNTVLEITSSTTTVTGGSFPAQSLQINFATNSPSVVDYSYSIGSVGSGSEALAGQGTNNILSSATLTNSGSELVLTIPINYAGFATALSSNDIQFHFTGRFVARASAAPPLDISSFQATPGQLSFTIATTPGKHYTILGSTTLVTFPTTNDQFTATNTVMTRNLSLPLLPSQFFRVRQDD